MTSGVDTLVVVAHLVATTAMFGLIWFVQLVHYPLFSAVGADEFVAYEASHQRRTAWVVGPFMAIEGITALALVAAPPTELGRLWTVAGLGMLGVVHASTVFLQVPAHQRLSVEYDSATVRRLVTTNWIRTLGWSTRTALATFFIIVAT